MRNVVGRLTTNLYANWLKGDHRKPVCEMFKKVDHKPLVCEVGPQTCAKCIKTLTTNRNV